ncbi:hypothetical protein BKA66DRAFT_258745 [Pyrenochaeta sp. MPI-SDFR-AT-0127]|nr:hypothetical protein BKA66DRAFT_258745 [Pyrenochaeta sp. MPI-SDFR-AT-0127]
MNNLNFLDGYDMGVSDSLDLDLSLSNGLGYLLGQGLYPNGSPSDNAHFPHSLPTRRNLIMSDEGYAVLTPSSSGDNSIASPAHSPLPVLDTPANSVRRPSNGRGEWHHISLLLCTHGWRRYCPRQATMIHRIAAAACSPY